jgi:predicted GNAT superfamily acetyltransferase
MRRGQAGPVAADAVATPVEVRAMRTPEDYAACVRLQRETWGMRYVDSVPASMLKVSQLLGGLCAGAFDESGELLGFVYGMTGLREGRLVHWSHMLAVSAAHRDHGIGRRLKTFQREVIRAQGIEAIYWTFDPLVARNAHLNLNRLGAEVQEYVPDMYGETGSRLHAFGTDRFVVAWPVQGRTVERKCVPAAWRGAPLAEESLATGAHLVSAGASAGAGANGLPAVRVEIPAAVEGLKLRQARRWRESTRAAFSGLLGRGYRMAGFYTDEEDRCYYVLEASPVMVEC